MRPSDADAHPYDRHVGRYGRALADGLIRRAGVSSPQASKTALALMAAQPDLADFVPPEHGAQVRSGRVPDHTWVGYFTWAGTGPVLGLGLSEIDGAAWNGGDAYVALFAFGNLGFLVSGFPGRQPFDPAIGGEMPPLLQFHPPLGRRIDWPPNGAFQPPVIDLLSFMPLRPDNRTSRAA